MADIRAVHHPFIRELFLAAQTRQSQGLKPFGAEDPREIVGPEQDVALLLAPLSTLLVDCTCWHNQMDMGMIVQAACMGVQNRMGSSSAFQLSISSRERVNGLPRSFEQQIIGCALMIARTAA